MSTSLNPLPVFNLNRKILGQEFTRICIKGLAIKDNSPELSIKIAKDYFENNLSAAESNFDLADGFYSRSIPEDELELAFDTVNDGKFL